jgi:hypothetical protein
MIENVSCLFFILCHKEVAIVIHATEMKSKKKEEHVVADCTRSPNSLPSDYPPDDHKQQYNMQTPFNQLKKPKNNRFPSQGPFRPDKLCKK